MKIVTRLLWMPVGLVKGLFKIANDSARDIQNKRKYANAIIDNSCYISDDTIIAAHSHILAGCKVNFSKIGSYTYINKDTLLQNATIGNYCSIGNEVIIGPGRHPLHLFSTSPLFYKKDNTFKIAPGKEFYRFEEYKPVNIGNDVWIGARAIVMDGVTIGDGAVIAAGAVVTTDIEAYTIAGGIPAKKIRRRFPDDVCERLLNTKWWANDAGEVYNKKEHLEYTIDNSSEA